MSIITLIQTYFFCPTSDDQRLVSAIDRNNTPPQRSSGRGSLEQCFYALSLPRRFTVENGPLSCVQ
ncbi:hypothetical protein BD410DRAFT_642622 [Rickenella mellea]|uniref:Uncharacterized protein n=1 Tax=Rickenella mellea TaxID=50990 RepID=A0A4Y7PNU6_9AGAM|nr:hypothetical protein BD410DRAFT_642622 [Rickenella mellea]